MSCGGTESRFFFVNVVSAGYFFQAWFHRCEQIAELCMSSCSVSESECLCLCSMWRKCCYFPWVTHFKTYIWSNLCACILPHFWPFFRVSYNLYAVWIIKISGWKHRWCLVSTKYFFLLLLKQESAFFFLPECYILDYSVFWKKNREGRARCVPVVAFLTTLVLPRLGCH